jgi:clan AA aspartic protease (TIGR02281 family)
MRLAHLQFALISLLAALVSGLAEAEIYEWKDERGRVHFAQNLSQVPMRYRAQAEWRAQSKAVQEKEKDRVQRIPTHPGASPASPSPSLGSPARSERVYKVRVQRAGTGMLVGVRLNNSVTAPFLIDTGASDVLIPKRYADQLGFAEGDKTRTKRYATANGIVTRPVMTLRSVSLGGAQVEDVPASVTPDMQFGLLGLSFFNHFTYNIDTAQGIVTLVPNSLAATGAIRGGRSEAQWKAEYRNLTVRIARLDAEVERTPSSRSRELRRLAAARRDLERQLELLNGEADQARVPMAWRD